MNAWQQGQLGLDFGKVGSRRDRRSEAIIAERLTEGPTGQIRLMESVCERENMRRALRLVRKNKGAPGIDGMTVEPSAALASAAGRRMMVARFCRRFGRDGRASMRMVARLGLLWVSRRGG
jgi:hypothetical protein